MAYFSLSNGNDVFQAGDESDWIDARDGDDVIFGGWGDDDIYGGNGNDRLLGEGRNDRLYGEAGDDWLVPGTGAYHYLDGGSGTDTVSLADENGISVDLSSADANGIVRIYYSNFPGNYAALINVENVYGSAGNDYINGDSQNNRIWGSTGLDTLNGRGGDDIIDPGLGGGFADGGEGTDTLSLQSFSKGVNVDLERSYEGYDGSLFYFEGFRTTTQGVKRFQNIDGSNYDDKIAGNSQANILKGWGGNDEILGYQDDDTLVGGIGDDSLDGGNGNDTLNGYGGDPVYESDTLTGGSGGDTFVIGHSFSIFRSNSFATITDFKQSQGDKIQLRGSSGNYSLVTNDGGTIIYFNGTGNTSGHEIAYVAGVNNLSLTNSDQFTFTA